MRITFRTEEQGVPVVRAPRQEASRAFRIAFLVVVAVSFLAILGSFVGDGGLMVIYQQGQVKKDLRGKITAEEIRRQMLLVRVDRLKSDPLELERVAREELGLIRDREIVFDFREPGPR